jgi:P27 family predicted phage terminase small subunit
MTRGRKPKPTALRVLQGKAGHRPVNEQEPKPAPQIPPCPDHLSPAAQAEWTFITAELEPLGVLARLDKATLAGYCSEFAAWAECETFIQENGSVMTLRDDKGNIKWVQEVPQARLALKHLAMVHKFAAELGLSPSSRTRIHARPADKQNPTEEFLYGKK